MAYIGAGITRFNTADELTVTGTSEFGGNVSFGDNNITNVGSLQIDSIAGDADTNTNITFAGSDVITMTTAGSERLRLDASGNVGIGTSSPDHNLTLQANTSPIFEMVQVAGGPYKHQIAVGGNDLQLRASSGALIMYTGNADGASSTERMRLDSNGNLLVGKTSADGGVAAGHDIRATGLSYQTVDGGAVTVLNRLTSDGDIALFRKDGTTVGSIASGSSGNVFKLYGAFASGAGLGVYSNVSIRPLSNTGAAADGTVTLGHSTQRFKDLELSGSTRSRGTYPVFTGADVLGSTGGITSTGSNPIVIGTDGTERMRIDSSGTLLVGKTSEAIGTAGAEFRASGHQLNMTRASGPALNVNRLTDDGDLLGFYQDSSLIGTIGTNGDRPFFKNSTYGGLKVGTGYSVDAANNSTGAGWDNALDLGAGGTRWKDLYLSGGAYLGGTGSANKLDDYEEGTFTPVFISGASSWTYNFNNGRYVKVGKLCHIAIRIDAASVTSTNSSGVNIGGLPFTAATSNPPGSFAIGYNNNFHNGGHTLTALGNANSTSINLYQDDGSSLIGTEVNFTNDIYLSGTYETT